MRLQREKVELSPVYAMALPHDGHTMGYIRLVNFSQNAAEEMRHAITDLEVGALLSLHFAFCYC